MCDKELVPSKTYITEEIVYCLFTLTFQMVMEREEKGSSAKRMKIKLCTKPSKNEIFVPNI